ncbi:hypothetical protein I4U23_010493 [Adineta vaga]|nr:hypothetical protein I4U23_010493 [Adineta vaga]
MEDNLNQVLLFGSKQDTSVLVEKDNNVEEQESQEFGFDLSTSSPVEYETNSSVENETSTTTSEPTEDRKYRLHIGTQPGSYTSKPPSFAKTQKMHSQLASIVKIFINHLEVEHEVTDKPTFSKSTWGLEPYTGLILYGSHQMIMGIAALIGVALRQDAIGVFADHYPPHRVFTVKSRDPSLAKGQKALQLMDTIVRSHDNLCGQFDATGEYLEFHEFENSALSITTIQALENTIRRHGTHEPYEITESVSQSDLLEKKNYENAIKKANLEMYLDMINLTRASDKLYNKIESN